MADGRKFYLSLSGSDNQALVRAVYARCFGNAVPVALRVDSKDRKPSKDWFDKALASATTWVTARFGEDEFKSPWLSYTPGKMVKMQRFDTPLDMAATVELLAGLPFELAAAGEHYKEWTDAYPVAERCGFADGHTQHGWMCAFKGAGHDRLVSRRWLDHGPWKLHRAGDTSVVQFHQLDVDWKTALAQARVGHRRMGISDEGGFIQTGYVYAKDLKGDYVAAERRLRILVQERDLAPIEMLDAAAMKHYQVLGASQPIAAMAFMFTQEDRARRHLHELWLRGLECWVFKDGRAQRLDEGYAPQPTPLRWA